MTSHFLIPDIKSDEGLRLRAYPDPDSPLAIAIRNGKPTAGLSGVPWTIGYGATGPGIGPSTIWTQPQAEANLTLRVSTIVTQLTTNLPWFSNLSDLRQDVLANMTYNLGVEGLLGFHQTLSDIKAGEWLAAHDGMLGSLWARQVPKRAMRLASQMLTNTHEGPVGVVDPAPASFSTRPSTSFDIPPLPPAPISWPLAKPQPKPVVTPTRIAGGVGVVVATGAAAVVAGTGHMNTIDLSPIINGVLIPLLTSLLLGLLAWFVPWISAKAVQWFNIRISSQQAQVIENAMGHGINLAMHDLGTTLDASASVDMKNAAVAKALQYTMMTAGTEMKTLNITPDSVATRILARLPVVAPTAQVSP